MYERTTSRGTPSIPAWETLHTCLRGRMQELVQWALEAEVTELLGRARYQRRAEVDGVPGYRNGYGKPRKLTTPLGTVTLRRPGCGGWRSAL
jgi:putative transposase